MAVCFIPIVRISVSISSIDQGRAGETPIYQFLWWLLLASVGLGALCVVMALRDVRRYGFLLVLIGLVLLIHSVQAHKEYRFVFAVVPLWLVIGADVVARFGVRGNARVWGLAACFVRGNFNRWGSECVAFTGSGVSRFFQRDGEGGVHPRLMIRFLPRIAISPARPAFWACGRLTDRILTCPAITICTERYRFTMCIRGVR